MNWYQIGLTDIFHKLGTSENGLTDAESSQRFTQYGSNRLIEEKKISHRTASIEKSSAGGIP